MTFFRNLWTVAELELRQRIVSRSFYVLLGVFAGVLLLVVGIVIAATIMLSQGVDEFDDFGAVYGVTVFMVLFLATITTPILSGGAINADRRAGTLATIQITLLRPIELLLGKFLAAWVTSLSFAVVALPFLVAGALLGGPEVLVGVPSTMLMLVFELGFLSAIGVGFSGVARSQAFSIVFAYLAMTVMTVGSLVAFGAGGLLLTTSKPTQVIETADFDPETSTWTCQAPRQQLREYPRYDLVYPLLALNPFVMIADVTPTPGADDDPPTLSMLGSLKYGVRSVQITPHMPDVENLCTGDDRPPKEQRDVLDDTVPTWFIGGAIHTLLGAGLLALAWASLRTPARRLAPGARVA